MTSFPGREGGRVPNTDVAAERARWRAFAVCLGAGFVTLLDVSIVNVALPSVERSLAASASDLQWIVAGYTLAFGLTLVPAGRIGDVLGRRSVFVFGLGAFVVASAACGLAVTPEMLALTRLVQGLSAGVLNPQVSGFIQQLFTGRERARAFGLFGATIGVSTATGPLLGGGLLAIFGEAEGWRSVFLVNVPIGAALIVLGLRHLPRPAGTRAARARLDIDVVGLVLVAASVLCVMLPFISLAGRRAGGTPWWLLGVAVVLLAVFWWWERRTERAGRSPVLAAELTRDRSFTFGSAVGTAYFAGFTGIFLVGTLYLQLGLGLTPLQAGLVQTPFALVSGASAAVSGRLVQHFQRWTIVVGIVVMSAGVVAVDVVVGSLDGTRAALAMGAWLALAGLGNGAVISPNQTLTLQDVPVRMGGTAGGVLQTAQRIGAAVGIAIVSSVFFAALADDGGPGARAHGYGPALTVGLRFTLGLFAIALVLALADAVRRARHRRAGVPPAA
ncbi:MFS transporter [Georgenia ruanii]|uniref:MFS transporter n=1 Tax=Georgenia ruanii TaxID=348442 RepID=UPI001D02741F|nr:MFS transporter [Georgenia ruanii]